MQTLKLEIDATILAVAESAARDAGALALNLQHGITAERKSARDLVTEADYACEKLIIQKIRDTFPNHAIVAEESGTSGESEFTWYVDPIDGTINYAHGLPIWGISVACCRDNQPIVGVIFIPALNECYTATADGPSLLNGKPISVSDTTDLELAIVLNSDFNTSADPDMRAALNDAAIAARKRQAATVMRSRCLGSAVVEAAWVASGRVDAYLMLKVHSWDIAAGYLIVSRAGGRASGADGTPWDPSVTHALLSNGCLHDLLLATPPN